MRNKEQHKSVSVESRLAGAACYHQQCPCHSEYASWPPRARTGRAIFVYHSSPAQLPCTRRRARARRFASTSSTRTPATASAIRKWTQRPARRSTARTSSRGTKSRRASTSKSPMRILRFVKATFLERERPRAGTVHGARFSRQLANASSRARLSGCAGSSLFESRKFRQHAASPRALQRARQAAPSLSSLRCPAQLHTGRVAGCECDARAFERDL